MSQKDFRPDVHGWLVLDKPLGLTSTQALGRVRRLLGGKKAGHGGTLDPLATGVLPLAFGEATKVIPFVMDGDKEYEFTVQWGEARSTGDAEGEVIARSDVRPTEEAIRNAIPKFLGNILQKPPAFSAIKIQGERAYDLARAGEVVELQEREVRIDALDLLEAGANSASFRVACGKGMYVRSLALDLALACGTQGYVISLRRTKAGPFGIESSILLEKLETLAAEGYAKDALLPIRAALGAIPTLSLTQNEAHKLRLGQRVLIKSKDTALLGAQTVFAECEGLPIALVEPIAGEFRVLRGFHF